MKMNLQFTPLLLLPIAFLSDLKRIRGRDEAADYHGRGLFYAARDCLRGKVPDWLASDPAALQLIIDLAYALPDGADTKWEDAHVSISPDLTTEYWRKRNKASNFLKHADRDAKSHIGLGEIDNFELLAVSMTTYIEVAGKDGLGNEGFVFWLYFSATIGDAEKVSPDGYRRIVRELGELEQPVRLDFCREWLRDLNADS